MQAGRKDTLLYTNGQSAVDLLAAAGWVSPAVDWHEVLHDGPVPWSDTLEALYQHRAHHFAQRGWTSVEEALAAFDQRDRPLSQPDRYSDLYLLFEHDLYDQLQLIQILDRLHDLPAWDNRVYLYQFDTYIGSLTPDSLANTLPPSRPVTRAHLSLGRQAWAAFRAAHPAMLFHLLDLDTAVLPFLRPAILRLLDEHPDPRSGLGRTERYILETLAAGTEEPGAVFHAVQHLEPAAFMGDASFFALMERLSSGPTPLITTDTATPFRAPVRGDATRQRLRLTDTGAAVLACTDHWLRHLPEPYWIGGCLITPFNA